jgi:hypothetical protein
MKANTQKRVSSKMSSFIIENVLNTTFPKYAQLFPFKKKELNEYIFQYLFNNDEEMFYKIGAFTNMTTASGLKGFQLLVQKNDLKSFEEFDLLMNTKKARTFVSLNALLDQYEILDDKQKEDAIGGRKTGEQPYLPYSIYFYPTRGWTG